MRLQILDTGHGLRAKALLAFIKLVSRRPAPDVVKTLKYRSDFFGDGMSSVFQSAMREQKAWSVGDVELMAAFVSKTNECEF